MSGSNGNGNAARLYEVMSAVLGVSSVDLSDESSPDTLPSWDSLNHLNIIMAMEGEFGIELSPDDAFNMGDVAKIRAVLRDYGVEI
jgi:acyl carrier protein